MATSQRVLKISDAWHWFAEVEQLLLNARVLMQRGWKVDVACQPESPLWQRAAAAGATLHALPGIRGRNPLARPANVIRIARLLDHLRPQIVHPYRSPPHALTAAARVICRHPVPLVRSRGAAQKIKKNPLNSWLYRGADAVIASSSVIAADLRQLGLSTERIRVVRGGVDVDRVTSGDGAAFRQQQGLPQQIPLMGILGRLAPIKGHRYAFEALAELHNRGLPCHLICAGEPRGQTVEQLEQQVSALGLTGKVHLLGRVDDVAGFLAALDVAVIASIGSELIARALMEEMVAGCAIVATEVGVIPEILDASTGIVVPPRNASALASAVGQLLEDPQLGAKLGRTACDRIRSEYSLEKLGEALEETYSGAMNAFSRAD